MPDFWQFPTVSMGLGPLTAIYQARFMKYLQDRGLVETEGRKVWAFLGDGETDEPESLGAISLAGREKLDNLIFVVNCNLQRLDGPVRGNGKIIQELEGVFRGAGWNVIKVIWGRHWDPLLAKDTKGLLLKRMEECVDGDYQNYKAKDGAYVRQHFFGKYPELLEMVANMSDEDVWRLNRGGHDPLKVYAAYAAATQAQRPAHRDPGQDGEGLRHGRVRRRPERHPPGEENVRRVAASSSATVSTFPSPTTSSPSVPFYRPAEDSPEMQYLQANAARRWAATCRRAGKGAEPLDVPVAHGLRCHACRHRRARDFHHHGLRAHSRHAGQGQGDRQAHRAHRARRGAHFRHGRHVPPARHLFLGRPAVRAAGRRPGDVLPAKPRTARSSRKASTRPAPSPPGWRRRTSYSNHGVAMIPFYIFYSMFGFQRIGDLAWAAGDARARGFLLGGTAGRTTLNGEGLQHEDGHSHLLAATIPNCVTYDPTYAYELAVIIQDGLRRMYKEQEDVYYYLTVMNENYVHPPMPKGVEEGIIKGMYLLKRRRGEEEAQGAV